MPISFTGSVSSFVKEMDGLTSVYLANHELGRFITVARVHQPNGEVAHVGIENIDEDGNVSKDVAKITSTVPMLGTLTLL